MYYLLFACILGIYWILLSGHTGILLLTLGLASVILVVWLVRRMDANDKAPARMIFSMDMVAYLSWLFWQVIRSNIDVARRIWDPSLPIRPACRKINVSLKDPLLKSIYANSITLTPGTVTIEVGEDYFVVHALNAEGLDELEEGDMERRLKRMEKNL